MGQAYADEVDALDASVVTTDGMSPSGHAAAPGGLA